MDRRPTFQLDMRCSIDDSRHRVRHRAFWILGPRSERCEVSACFCSLRKRRRPTIVQAQRSGRGGSQSTAGREQEQALNAVQTLRGSLLSHLDELEQFDLFGSTCISSEQLG